MAVLTWMARLSGGRTTPISASRRKFLGWASASTGYLLASRTLFARPLAALHAPPAAAPADIRFSPHYPKQPPIEDVLRYLRPGLDEFVNEKYAEQVEAALSGW